MASDIQTDQQNWTIYDVVIVGAGPAGLSAALILGRCRRRVLICDKGQPRNAASHSLHCFLTRDGIEPYELLSLGRMQLRPYPTVELRRIEVTDAVRADKHFELSLADGSCVYARKLLLATGVVDDLPSIKGIEFFYGHSVFHCPYCDGWEVRDQPLAIYGAKAAGRQLALELTMWSRDLVLCTDGPSGLDEQDQQRLARHGIVVRDERIDHLEGKDGQLECIVFANGEELPRRALFFAVRERQHANLAARLGSAFTHRGSVRTDEDERTSVPGLYVAGDAARRVQLAIVAASEGAEAAFAINTALLKEDLI
jgi:thioredoxin reductase